MTENKQQEGRPVGIFDSGYGGLTIFRSIEAMLPQYQYVYLGDNARAPYGARSFEAVLRFTTEAVRHLLGAEGCRLVIIACNTASARALRNIQQLMLPEEFPDRRVLGIIRPSVEVLGNYTHTKTVALWATNGTVRSESFLIEMAHHFPEVKVVQQACPLLVPLIEAGELEGPGVDHFIRKYWELTVAQSPDIDTLLLACTHYPLLHDRIRAIVPSHVRIVTQGGIVAHSLQDYLQRHPEIERDLARSGGRDFLTTDRTEGFDQLGEVFLGHPIRSRKVEID
jgi:glutamate racemase